MLRCGRHAVRVHTLITDVAEYAIYLVAAGALLVWLVIGRRNKLALAVQGAVAVIVVAILVWIAGKLHTDPRPFVVNHHLKPFFHHAPDNGFPSDHTALGAAVSFVVMWWRRIVGGLLLVVSVGMGAARVAAHVHHVQDIVAGALLGLLAATIAVLLWHLLAGRLVRADHGYNRSEP